METKDVVYEKSSREDWDALIKEMNSGKKIEIHKSVYYYFLEVLPPKKMFDNGFWFAEGVEQIKEFTHEGDQFFVKQLNQWNGFE